MRLAGPAAWNEQSSSRQRSVTAVPVGIGYTLHAAGVVDGLQHWLDQRDDLGRLWGRTLPVEYPAREGRGPAVGLFR